TKSSVDFLGTATATGTATSADLNAGKLAGAAFQIQDSTGKNITITVGATYSALSSNAATVNSLDDLNNVLSAAGVSVSASLNTAGDTVSFTSTNDSAGQTITTAGTAPTSADAIDIKGTLATGTVNTAVADVASQNTRSSLVSQYNAILDQIKTTAQDSSFNGVNLLNGDNLKLVFNETGKSTLNISGFTDDATGLGLNTLTSGTDFNDNASTNSVLTALNSASTTLRAQASTLGSNLSVVQIRQDFSKNLINVLQTGASNLTLADTNEEAANSQALSTRQSIAVSALALANQSQQSVLKLLQ
ncbi:MAG: flagellin, partial [Devosia sp.]